MKKQTLRDGRGESKYISNTLNVTGLHIPIRRQRLPDYIFKNYMLLQEINLKNRNTKTWKYKGEKDLLC